MIKQTSLDIQTQVNNFAIDMINKAVDILEDKKSIMTLNNDLIPCEYDRMEKLRIRLHNNIKKRSRYAKRERLSS